MSEVLLDSTGFFNPRMSPAAERLRLARRRGSEAGLWDHLAALSPDGVLVVDVTQQDAPLVYVNAAFEQTTGYSAEEAVGKNCRFLWGKDELQPELVILGEAIRNRQKAQVTIRNYRKDGSQFWSELRVAPIFDHHRRVSHYLGVIRDVTDRKAPSRRADETASRDAHTGLLDRTSFKPQLEALMGGSDDGAFLVVKADIIGFQEFNTSFGYNMGDALLQEIADRLRRLDGALIGRTGADAFAIACRLQEPAAAAAVAEELHEALEAPYTLPLVMLTIRFAVGYTIGTKQHPAIRLLREGSAALHDAKRPGRRLVRYDKAIDDQVKVRGRLTSELQRAVADEDFLFHYQPKIELATGRLVGAEALIRWRHPVFGLQRPGKFIPLAEETGLILPLSQWAIRTVAAFAARCNEGRARPLPIACGVSAVDLDRFDLIGRLEEAIRESGVEPAWCTLAFTERVFAEGTPEIVAMLGQILDMGFGLSINDFGAHSAPSQYLDRLRASEIKIARSFVRGMLGNRLHGVVVESVIRLGEALGAHVTAEGVDTEAEAQALRDLNCPMGQGVFLGEPMPEEAFLALADREADSSWGIAMVA